MKNWLLVNLFLWCLSGLYAQTDTLYVLISGKLKDSKTQEVIPYATVYLKNTKKGTISNDSGYFEVRVVKTDTVRISSVGYKKLEMTVAEFLKMNNSIIYMEPSVHTLSEVVVRALPTYQQLKLLIVNAEPSYEEKQHIIFQENLEKLKIYDPVEIGMPSITGMPGPYISLFSFGLGKKGKSRGLVSLLKKKDNKRKKVEKIFNPDVVKRLTGLKDEKLIDRFMNYCAFTDKFILETSIYDLYNLIVKKYLAFKEEIEAC